MKLKTAFSILILTLSIITVKAQTKETNIIKTEITGDWKLLNVKDDKGTLIPDGWPFKVMQFHKDGTFVLTTDKDKAEGKYELNNNLIRLYDAIANGVKQPNEETLILSKLDSKSLIIEMDLGNGNWKIEYTK